MTGILSSNGLIRAFMVTWIVMGLAVADNITLNGGVARLSGNVVSINESGIVELATGISKKPLLLKNGTVEKIEFSTLPTSSDASGTIVELNNGDIVPGTIERLDKQHLHLATPFAGNLEIPRDMVKSIQPGIQPRNLVFKGPNSLDEWVTTDEGRNNLSFDKGIISANGPAAFSRKMDLTEQFILRFTVGWNHQHSPNYQVFMADPMLPVGEPADRYYLQFGGAGLEIKREASEGKRFTTIVILKRTREQFPDNRMNIEMHINRATARLKLRINGQSEGEFADPIPGMPTGSGISFVSNTSNGMEQKFSKIEVMEFDDSRVRHPAEERGDSGLDSLISREDDRWSGNLTEIKRTPKGLVYIFETDFKDNALEISESDVSIVFLAKGTHSTSEESSAPFVIRLPGEGALRVSSCHIGDDGTVTAKHPLLGELLIRRDGITSIERGSKPSKQ